MVSMLAASETPFLGVLLGYVKSSMTPYIPSNRFYVQVVGDLEDLTTDLVGLP